MIGVAFREATIADELVVADLPEDVKTSVNLVYDRFLEKRNSETAAYDKGYEDGIDRGRLDAVLTEKKDLAKLLTEIKRAIAGSSPDSTASFLMSEINTALKEYEDKIVV